MISLKKQIKVRKLNLEVATFRKSWQLFYFSLSNKNHGNLFPFHTLSRDFHKFLFFQISPLTIHAKVSTQMKKNDIT